MTIIVSIWDKLILILIIFDFKACITLLQSTLIPRNPYYKHLKQHPNIRAAIVFYENGRLDSRKVFISGEKVVSKEEVFSSGLPVWSKVNALLPLNPKYPYRQFRDGPTIKWYKRPYTRTTFK